MMFSKDWKDGPSLTIDEVADEIRLKRVSLSLLGNSSVYHASTIEVG